MSHTPIGGAPTVVDGRPPASNEQSAGTRCLGDVNTEMIQNNNQFGVVPYEQPIYPHMFMSSVPLPRVRPGNQHACTGDLATHVSTSLPTPVINSQQKLHLPPATAGFTPFLHTQMKHANPLYTGPPTIVSATSAGPPAIVSAMSAAGPPIRASGKSAAPAVV